MAEMPVMNILKRNTAMIKVFIDTNIMVDVLLGREKFLLQSSNFSNWLTMKI